MDLDGLLGKWERHLKVLRGLSDRTVSVYRRYVMDFFDWFSAHHSSEVMISDVGQKDVEAWLESLYYERKNGNYTRKTKLLAVATLWRFMVYDGIVKQDVTATIPRPIVRSRLVQSFTRDDVLRMFRQVDIYSEKGVRDGAILILLAFCGLRVGELTGLRLNDVKDDGTYIDILIPEDIGKKGSSRTIDLWKAPSVFVRQWIAIRLGQGGVGRDPLFTSYRRNDMAIGNKLAARDVERLVKSIADAAGIRKPRITCHMFRATHGHDLRHVQGYDIAAIASRLGHKNISTTDRYLPKRGRIKKMYPSLREYWLEWERIWLKGSEGGA